MPSANSSDTSRKTLVAALGYLTAGLYGIPRLVELVNGRAGPVVLVLPVAMVAITWALDRYPIPALVAAGFVALQCLFRLLLYWLMPSVTRDVMVHYHLFRTLSTVGALLWIAMLAKAVLDLGATQEHVPS